MKTAVSIPDELFEKAEKVAKDLGLPRSQLFAKAIEEFIDQHSRENLTERLNSVYMKENINSKQESQESISSVMTLRETLSNDSW